MADKEKRFRKRNRRTPRRKLTVDQIYARFYSGRITAWKRDRLLNKYGYR